MKFERGQKVSYNTDFGQKLKGFFKKKATDGYAFVVFDKSATPENYNNYTGQRCLMSKLTAGWD